MREVKPKAGRLRRRSHIVFMNRYSAIHVHSTHTQRQAQARALLLGKKAHELLQVRRTSPCQPGHTIQQDVRDTKQFGAASAPGHFASRADAQNMPALSDPTELYLLGWSSVECREAPLPYGFFLVLNHKLSEPE
ncbi:hypothetical protein XENTR_v10016123 [Xenopus tropicalis]|nr:hypothetical protein XENTR_v10016123 [Xenopus tropicalis]